MSPFDFLCKGKKKWSTNNLREEKNREVRMLECGARLLQELITSCDGKICYPIRIFSAKELIKATDGFSHHMHESIYYNYYKGTYQDHPIHVKRFIVHEFLTYDTVVDHAFNEIVMLTQINHRNVVKLLGCCFEMEKPILIYESVPNGSLSRHIKESNPSGPISSWDNRLRIATEIADAVTYLHTATSRPIVHTDIKCCNILLDEQCTPKLCDFIFSVTIPEGQTHVESNIVGTSGFGAPEYKNSGNVTEKIDVYNFGMLLFELLAGNTHTKLLLLHHNAGTRFKNFVIQELLKKKSIDQILDVNIPTSAKNNEQVIAYIQLAVKCVASETKERPSMKEVTLELRRIKKSINLLSSSSSSSSRVPHLEE